MGRMHLTDLNYIVAVLRLIHKTIPVSAFEKLSFHDHYSAIFINDRESAIKKNCGYFFFI